MDASVSLKNAEQEKDGATRCNTSHVTSNKQPRITYVIDCGSGHSRCFAFDQSTDGGVVCVKDLTRDLTYPPAEVGDGILVKALQAGPEGIKGWVTELRRLTAGAVRIVVAATAGVRQALQKGDITKKDLAALEQALKGTAVFRLLTGAEEARAEYTAVKHCALVDRIAPPKGFEAGAAVQLLSAGGMSAQLGVGTFSCSIDVNSFEGTRIVREGGTGKDGKSAGLAQWDAQVTALVASALKKNGVPSGGFKGMFVCIEIAADVFEWAFGVSKGGWVSRDTFLATVDTYVAAMGKKLSNESVSLPIKQRYPCFKLSYALYIRRYVEHALQPGSFMIALGKPGDDCKRCWTMAPTWTLGVYLQSRS